LRLSRVIIGDGIGAERLGGHALMLPRGMAAFVGSVSWDDAVHENPQTGRPLISTGKTSGRLRHAAVGARTPSSCRFDGGEQEGLDRVWRDSDGDSRGGVEQRSIGSPDADVERDAVGVSCTGIIQLNYHEVACRCAFNGVTATLALIRTCQITNMINA